MPEKIPLLLICFEHILLSHSFITPNAKIIRLGCSTGVSCRIIDSECIFGVCSVLLSVPPWSSHPMRFSNHKLMLWCFLMERQSKSTSLVVRSSSSKLASISPSTSESVANRKSSTIRCFWVRFPDDDVIYSTHVPKIIFSVVVGRSCRQDNSILPITTWWYCVILALRRGKCIEPMNCSLL